MTADDGDVDDQNGGGRRGMRIAGWSGAGLIVALAAAYAGVAAAKADTVPPDTSVAGVDVGGMSRDAAQHKLDRAFVKRAEKPITITVGGDTLKLSPKQAGLTFDPSHALDGMTGFSLAPATMLRHFSGGTSVDHVATHVDREKLRESVASLSSKVHHGSKNGDVTFDHGTVKVTKSTPGTDLDTDALVEAIGSGWPAKHAFTGDVKKTPAPLTNKEIDAFVTTFARPAMSGPVTVKAAGHSTKLTPTMVSGVLSAKTKGGKITPVIDTKGLERLLDKIGGNLVEPPVNAKVTFQNGEPEVTPAKKGSELDTDGADKALLAALTADDRTMELDTRAIAPEVSTKQVKAQIKDDKKHRELMSRFVSPYPTGPQNAARTHNIKVALERIDGTYVAPGEQFSLLKALMPITGANGYVDAPVLVGGVDVPGMGGGISQVSTTMYNATFFAGLQEDEHTAHGYWISRYPMGREATLWVPTIDNKWTNDSGHGIIIKAGTEGNAAVISLYGRDVFTVTSHTGEPFNIVPPKTRVLHTAHCMEQPPVNGFDVTVTRVVKRGGKVVKNESLTTHYNPADRVICK